MYFRNRVAQTTNSAGIGNLELNGSINGFKAFAGQVPADDAAKTVSVLVKDGDAWELFETYLITGTPNQLFRGALIGSSAIDGSRITLTNAANKPVYLLETAETFGAMGWRSKFALTAGTAPDYTAVLPVPIRALKNGVRCTLAIHAVNPSSPVTFAPDGLAAKPVKFGRPLRTIAANRLPTGLFVDLEFSETADAWVVVSPLPAGVVKTVAGSTYTVVEEDHGLLLNFTNAAGCAVTLPQSTGQFAAPFDFNFIGGALTFTPTTSTINGQASLAVAGGGRILADGGNYLVSGAGGAVGRNRIINGKMDIAQRGASFAAVATAAYALDRWQYRAAGAGVVTISQQADAPADNKFQNSLRVAVTTADASIAAGDIYVVQQPIEGYNVRDLIGDAVVVSFRVRSPKTGVHCVFFGNSGADRSFVAEYTVNAVNTWETKLVVIPAGLITAGTWDWQTGKGLVAGFVLAAGSTFQTTAGAWQTGNFVATANQVNCMDTIGNIFAVTGVHLGRAAEGSDFDHRPYHLEVLLCERYYEKCFPLGVAPAQNVGAAYFAFAQIAGASVAQLMATVTFRARKRGAPTVVFYNPQAANAQIRNTGTSTDFTSSSPNSVTENGFGVLGTSPGGSAAGQACAVNWSADAEI
jgi:hypothetical protein